jgi:MFS transporter, DHA1 family, inner membrane transport protein
MTMPSPTSRLPLPILALALAAFAIGTTEFVIMGILPDVARDLGVSIPSAGLLVSGYALGVAVGAPLLATLTARWPPKATLVALMGVFVAGNLVSALAPSYDLLMVGRVVASFAHGSFFGLGAVVAAGLVPLDRRAAAIALMFTGLTLANVLGVPLGTLIGQQFGWRATFWAVSAFGAMALVGVALLVPRTTSAGPDRPGSWGVLWRPQVLLALALTVFGFGGIFTAFTYITPMLQELAGFSPRAVSGILFLFGLGLTLGNTLGGRLADWKPAESMLGILIALALVEALLSVTIVHPTAAVLTVFVWGVAAFATVPGLQMRVVDQARESPTLASTLNIPAFNLGNAGGAWLGGRLIEARLPLHVVPLGAAAMALVAIAIAGFSIALERRGLRAIQPEPRADQSVSALTRLQCRVR